MAYASFVRSSLWWERALEVMISRSYVIVCNGLCGVVKVGNYVDEPTLGVEMGSCEGMLVELCIDIVFDRLGDDAAIMVDDILESCDWRLLGGWWGKLEESWVILEQMLSA